MSNIKGLQFFGDNWKIIDLIELEAYIGLQILAGVYKSHNESLIHLWDENNGRPIFRATMSLERLMNTSRCLRFDSAADRDERRQRDKLAPIRNIWDQWNRQLRSYYHLHENVTIDEQLVPFRGRCSFRQYIPSKPAKYGLKIWALCDSKSKYAWNMEVYLGRARNTQPERNQGERVILSLSEPLPRGHTITCDNFFTTYNLAVQLLRRNITLVGTVRKNKLFLPREIVDMKEKNILESKFLFTENVTIVSYVPKKYKFVVALSSLHHFPLVDEGDRKKPEIILHYNKTKACVDALDQLVTNYTCKRQTKWPVALFLNMLDISAYNAYVIWTEINPSWNTNKLYKRRLFLEDLGKQMVEPNIVRRERLPRGIAAKNIVKNIQENSKFAGEASTSNISARNESTKKRQRCFFCHHTKNSNK
ncbi:piggyBac transposable element-derived protein 4-like [Bactrocera tryoni]|uniref:piggyBac transposable element-derived protein 4-like n=1 Tax=Bactrocera tryoni TaxID=59916 RepID=UPI001A96BDCF|nr:piggyBac transposable element-derived protein 4-like [Bactrocera tryoni]